MFENKIEVRISKFGTAGMYEIRSLDIGVSPDLILKLGKGQPYDYAHRDAERLAIILNCDLYLDDKLIRKAIKRDQNHGN